MLNGEEVSDWPAHGSVCSLRIPLRASKSVSARRPSCKESSEDGDEGEHSVEQGAGVRHQQLLAVHHQSRDEDLGGGKAAPADDGGR